jgi:Phosphotransferase enzyme family
MSDLKDLDPLDVLSAAQSALSNASGKPVELDEPRLLSGVERRNLIVRARATDDGQRLRSVIVKATRAASYDPNSNDALAGSGLVREWVATAYLATRAPGGRHGSTLLAGDVSRGILVFEDLGAGLDCLVEPLLNGTAGDAERALLSYAIALGRLHADTTDCRQAHRATFRTIFGEDSDGSPKGRQVEQEAELIVDRIGGHPPTSELAALSARLSDPGPWSCLVHGDPCPDNALLVEDQVRLIDYEFARPSHALLDGIYWRIGFPTCWCAGRVPAEIAARVDAAYRSEIKTAIPQARDDNAYEAELAHMAAIWLFTCLSWRLDEALKEDATWGIASIRSRLLWYLEAMIELTGAAGVLPGLRATADIWLADLRRSWPDTTPLGAYPAFAANRAD